MRMANCGVIRRKFVNERLVWRFSCQGRIARRRPQFTIGMALNLLRYAYSCLVRRIFGRSGMLFRDGNRLWSESSIRNVSIARVQHHLHKI